MRTNAANDLVRILRIICHDGPDVDLAHAGGDLLVQASGDHERHVSRSRDVKEWRCLSAARAAASRRRVRSRSIPSWTDSLV